MTTTTRTIELDIWERQIIMAALKLQAKQTRMTNPEATALLALLAKLN